MTTKTMKATKKQQPDTDPMCASCNERKATGTLFITFDPFEQQRMKPEDRFSSTRIERGFRLHMPICGECCKKSCKVSLHLDLKTDQNVWGSVDPIASVKP